MKEIVLRSGGVVLVDDEDYEWLAACKWYDVHGYARGKLNGKQVAMHRIVANAPSQIPVDHINGVRLDNRRSNLRLCTNSQNSAAVLWSPANKTSRFRGVCWDKIRVRWRATIEVNGIKHGLGGYPTEEEAARAYNRAASEYFGEFARLNDVSDMPMASHEQYKKVSRGCSGYVGVTWHPHARRWRAGVSVNGKWRHIGSFLTPEAASEARQTFLAEHKQVSVAGAG